MYDIASQVQSWLADERQVRVAVVVATRGFSSREPGAALAWTDDAAVGALFPTVDVDLVAAGPQLDGRLVEVPVSDSDAVATGLACGGVATVLVQPAAQYPAETWTRLSRNQPVCLLTEINGDATAVTSMFTPANVREAVHHPGGDGVPRLFASGVSRTEIINADEITTVIVTLWPQTSLLVVGDGTIASALTGAAQLLEWNVAVTNDASSAATAANALAESDAIVVLSHDRDVDGPALEAALAGRAGYIGAMGSRRTQAARREWLTARGVTEQALARVHGPAGLDIDAHTPAEIAISITAEILANRAGTSGAPIRDRSGPVHAAGVNAPPPRY